MRRKTVEFFFEADLMVEDFDLEISTIEEYDLALENDDNYDILLEGYDGAQEYSLDIEQEESLDYFLDSGIAIVNYIEGEIYDGPHKVTPSQETQVLQTNGYLLTSDITIDPIPSNYGLITWNGSILTVS